MPWFSTLGPYACTPALSTHFGETGDHCQKETFDRRFHEEARVHVAAFLLMYSLIKKPPKVVLGFWPFGENRCQKIRCQKRQFDVAAVLLMYTVI